MKIALDYDLTYSADPGFWDMVIVTAQAMKHDIRIVTARNADLDRTAALVELEEKLPIVYCGGVAKRWFCTHYTDFVPDIWIDDKPESIDDNSSATPATLQAWRDSRNEGESYPPVLIMTWDLGEE